MFPVAGQENKEGKTGRCGIRDEHRPPDAVRTQFQGEAECVNERNTQRPQAKEGKEHGIERVPGSLVGSDDDLNDSHEWKSDRDEGKHSGTERDDLGVIDKNSNQMGAQSIGNDRGGDENGA